MLSHIGFILIHVRLVASSVIVGCVLFMLSAFWGVFSSAHAQEVLPEQSALITACDSARNLAVQDNLNMERCRRVSEVYDGSTALVTVKVWITDIGQFNVSVVLYKSIWTQQHFNVQPAG